MPLIPLTTLTDTVLHILRRSGYPPDEAQTIHDILMYAQLRGNNQGIVKLIGAGMPRDPGAVPMQIVHETKLSALIDGGKNAGMVALSYATTLALVKAREHGFGIVGTRNTKSSTGAIGYYVDQVARAGFIGIVFSGSGEFVAMHGSYEPLFGTNPLAFGIPTGSTPIVFDMATSAIARYGIVEAKAANRPIPPDVAYDADGKPTTDAGAALAGAIRTFGGYKGAALSLMVEILTGAFVGTGKDAAGHKDDWGNLIMVIDPALMGDRDAFAAGVVELIARVKGTTKRLEGVDEILVPGERGNRIWEGVKAAGAVEIEPGLWAALEEAAK